MEKFLIRIDRSTIHSTQWIFGFSKGFYTKMKRPAKLRLVKVPQRGWCFEKDEKRFGNKIGAVGINVSDYEITWIYQLLEEFDQEVPVTPDTKEAGSPQQNQPEPGRSVLETMEYHEKSLRLILNPAEINKRKIESPKDGLLFARCSRCHLPIPNDSVRLDIALGVCPHCGNLFQIAELKRHSQPARRRVDLYENEDGLHLHQRPQWICMASVCFMFLMLFDLSFGFLFFTFHEANPDLTLQMITDAIGWKIIFPPIITVHLVCILGMFVTFFSNWYVDFRRKKTTFRYRWLFFQYQWSVLSGNVGAFYETLITQILLHGFYIPYGTNRSFRVAAREGEVAWLVSEINRWRWRNPPQMITEFNSEFNEKWNIKPDEKWQPDTAVSGITENEKEYIVHCHACGERISANHFKQGQCSCGEKLLLRQCDYYVMEKTRGIPESELSALPSVEGFNVANTEEFLQMEYTPKPRSAFLQFCDSLGMLFVFLFVFAIFFLPSFPMIVKEFDNGGEFWFGFAGGVTAGIAFFLFNLLMLLLWLPLMLMYSTIFFSFYDFCRAGYAGWSVRIDCRKFQITRRYKKRVETLEFDWDRIVEIRYGNKVLSIFTNIAGSPIFGKFPSLLCSSGKKSIEMVLDDGSIEYLPQLPEKNSRNKVTSPGSDWLINQWNEARFLK
jgi:hypothetical protein